MDRLVADQSVIKFPNPNRGLGISGEKTNDINPPKEKWRSLRKLNPSFKIENLAS